MRCAVMPLMQCAFTAKCRCDDVRALLAAGAPTTATDEDGNSALHLAACADDACLVKLLLRKVRASGNPSRQPTGENVCFELLFKVNI